MEYNQSLWLQYDIWILAQAESDYIDKIERYAPNCIILAFVWMRFFFGFKKTKKSENPHISYHFTNVIGRFSYTNALMGDLPNTRSYNTLAELRKL